MADLMADLSPWILSRFFGLVAYMRQAAAQHEALTSSIGNRQRRRGSSNAILMSKLEQC